MYYMENTHTARNTWPALQLVGNRGACRVSGFAGCRC